MRVQILVRQRTRDRSSRFRFIFKMSIDWKHSSDNWIAKKLKNALQISQTNFEEIANYVKMWFSINNFNFSLTTKEQQIATKRWAKSDLRSRFQHIWNNILLNTSWHLKVSYDFMRFVFEREATKLRRDVSKMKETQLSSLVSVKSASKTRAKTFLFLLHIQSSIESSFRFSTILTSFKFSSTLTSFESSTTFTSKTIFLTFLRDEVDETVVDAKHISIDELAIDASNLIFNNSSALIRYITLTRLRTIFAQKEMNENFQLFSFVAFEFSRSFITNLKLREDIRWIFNVNCIQFVVFSD